MGTEIEIKLISRGRSTNSLQAVSALYIHHTFYIQSSIARSETGYAVWAGGMTYSLFPANLIHTSQL